MAAGLGFKTFTTGEVLTAADVNGYLMQGILVFANAAARTSAITAPQEGQYSFLKDTNALEYYDGAAWVGAPVGDITAVTAGTGISGGGSSGAVTITNDMATTITASGDIVVGTGSGTYDNLPIGSTGQVLTADTTVSPYKVKWAAPAGGGKLLQLVSATYTTETDVSTTTMTDSGLTATITPSSTASRIYVQISAPFLKNAGNASNGVKFRIMRGVTEIADWLETSMQTGTTIPMSTLYGINYVDSPSTTSATTYKLQFANVTAASFVRICSGGDVASIQLLEIGA